jgi:hypothetical protein
MEKLEKAEEEEKKKSQWIGGNLTVRENEIKRTNIDDKIFKTYLSLYSYNQYFSYLEDTTDYNIKKNILLVYNLLYISCAIKRIIMENQEQLNEILDLDIIKGTIDQKIEFIENLYNKNKNKNNNSDDFYYELDNEFYNEFYNEYGILLNHINDNSKLYRYILFWGLHDIYFNKNKNKIKIDKIKLKKFVKNKKLKNPQFIPHIDPMQLFKDETDSPYIIEIQKHLYSKKIISSCLFEDLDINYPPYNEFNFIIQD